MNSFILHNTMHHSIDDILPRCREKNKKQNKNLTLQFHFHDTGMFRKAPTIFLCFKEHFPLRSHQFRKTFVDKVTQVQLKFIILET